MIATETKQKINRNDKAFYDTNGFLVLKNLFSAPKIQELNDEYDRLFNRRAGWEQGGFFDLGGDEESENFKMPQLISPSQHSQTIKNSGIHEKCALIARELMGLKNEDELHTWDHAIMKPASNSVPTPWHQDEAYWSNDHDHNSCSFWIPLHHVDYSRGCMCFIPQSHKHGIKEHQHINNDKRIHGLETLNVDETNMAICPLTVGSATVHHSKTLHFTPINASGLPRKALIVVCRGPSVKLSTPRNYSWQQEVNTKRLDRVKPKTN